jgi:protein-S-isoprenylcysteine O-methyltransferase Ste14
MKTQKIYGKSAFWTIAVFYMLVAFEFFYMASPFAIYFYSVYKPGLNVINNSPGFAWLVSFFLPHIVTDTSSPLINNVGIIGAVLAGIGLLAFCIGAGQVYYYKLTRMGAVTGGIYNYIRHPQYVSLVICSFGLLLLWPRYLALIMFVTITFAYYILARIEEKECEKKFGMTYLEYKNRTNMFIPFRLPSVNNSHFILRSKSSKIFAFSGLFLVVMTLSLVLARLFQHKSIDSLYTSYSKDADYISLCRIEPGSLNDIIKIACENKEVASRIDSAGIGPDSKFLNYVLPAGWYVSEIPMNPVSDAGCHSTSSGFKKSIYKIVFTKAHLLVNRDFQGKDIILHTAMKTPVVEVWVDLETKKVVAIKNPPQKINYQNIPVPVY